MPGSMRCISFFASLLCAFSTYDAISGFLTPITTDLTGDFKTVTVRRRRHTSSTVGLPRQHETDFSTAARRRLLLLAAESDSGERSTRSKDDSGGDFRGEEDELAGNEESEPQSLAALVEKTFVLAAAADSYVEGLNSFIKVVKEAYERGYTVPALTMEVSFVPTKVRGEFIVSCLTSAHGTLRLMLWQSKG